MRAPSQIDWRMRPLTWVHSTLEERMRACVESLHSAGLLTDDERRDIVARVQAAAAAKRDHGGKP